MKKVMEGRVFGDQRTIAGDAAGWDPWQASR
jgi:hypothetical protein